MEGNNKNPCEATVNILNSYWITYSLQEAQTHGIYHLEKVLPSQQSLRNL
jgi:hypothetical protein